MGIVRQESVRSTFYSYIGVVIGFVSQTFIYTNLLSVPVVGLIKVLQSFANLFSRVSMFNLQGITVRFFPYFRDKERGHHGFLFFILAVATGGFMLFFAATLVFRKQILSLYIEKSALFADYFNFVFPIVLALALMLVLSAYLRALYKIIYATIVREVYIKLFTLAAILLYYFKVVNFDGFLICFSGAYLAATLMLVFYIIRIGEFKIKPEFKKFDKGMIKEMGNFTIFGYLSEVLQSFIQEIDKLMLAWLVGLASTGIYGVTSLFGYVISLPQQAINNISSSVIAQAFKDNDLGKILEMYRKTAINQLIIGNLFFILIWFNTDSFLSFMPAAYGAGKYVVLIVGITKLFDMATGINGAIINLSKFYRFIFISNIISMFIIVGLNMVLIPVYGLEGSASATLITIVFFNIVKMIFIWKKFRMQPFTFQTLKALAVLALVSVVAWIIPFMNIGFEQEKLNVMVDVILRSGIILILFSILTIAWKTSDDVNDFYFAIKGRINKIIKKSK